MTKSERQKCAEEIVRVWPIDTNNRVDDIAAILARHDTAPDAEMRSLQDRCRQAEETAKRAGWDLDTANATILELSAISASDRELVEALEKIKQIACPYQLTTDTPISRGLQAVEIQGVIRAVLAKWGRK